MSYTPHSPAVAAAFLEILSLLREPTPFDHSESVSDNWDRLCKQSDQAVHVLIRVVKQLDRENFLLRQALGLPEEENGDDEIVNSAIAYLDQDRQ